MKIKVLHYLQHLYENVCMGIKKEGRWLSMILQSATTRISNFYGSHNHCG